MDFDDAWKAYRTWLLVSTDSAHSTVDEYGSVLRRWNRHLEHHGVAWDQIGRGHLNRFLARPAAAGPRRGQPLSVNRRRTDTSAIHGLYRFAVQAGIIDRDPLALVRLPRRREGPPRSFTPRQLAVILREARHDDRLYLLCLLGVGEGLRRAEMAALDLADLDREPWPGQLRVLGKGGRERYMPLSAKVRRALDRHLGDRANLVAGPLLANHTRPGQGLRPQTVGDLLADHIRACPDPDRPGETIGSGSAHWLRHSFVYLALRAAEGANLEEVREAVGHVESRQTRRYGQRYQWQVRRKVIDIMGDPEDPEASQ